MGIIWVVELLVVFILGVLLALYLIIEDGESVVPSIIISVAVCVLAYLMLSLLNIVTMGSIASEYVEIKEEPIYSMTNSGKKEAFVYGFGDGAMEEYSYFIHTGKDTSFTTTELPSKATKIVFVENNSKPKLLTYEQRFVGPTRKLWFGAKNIFAENRYQLKVPKEAIQMDLDLK